MRRGIVNTKLAIVKGQREVMDAAINAASINPTAIAALSNNLQSGLQVLLEATTKYQLSVDRYLLAAKGSEEETKEYSLSFLS